VTALRLNNVLKLKWEQVDWAGERLAFRTKSKKPGGEFHYLPMTSRMKAMLKRRPGTSPRVRVYL
jgi:integrase